MRKGFESQKRAVALFAEDREAWKRYHAEWQRSHPELLLSYTQRYLRHLRGTVMDVLGGRQCKRCGYDTDERALQIDHVTPCGSARVPLYKTYRSIVVAASTGDIEFLEGYQVLCANCHQIKTWEDRQAALMQRIKRSVEQRASSY